MPKKAFELIFKEAKKGAAILGDQLYKTAVAKLSGHTLFH